MANTLIKYDTICNISQISMPDSHFRYPKQELEYHNFSMIFSKSFQCSVTEGNIWVESHKSERREKLNLLRKAAELTHRNSLSLPGRIAVSVY